MIARLGRTALVLTVLSGLVSGTSMAQILSTDIFLVSVDGTSVGAPRAVTDREGYDNQPQFLPDGKSLVYSSLRDGSTNIVRYDVRKDTHVVAVDVGESLYSPTPIPGRKAISVVRDYGDLKQQLWSFPLDGGPGELLLSNVNPVGYHAWVDQEDLILFVLGPPATLQRASVGPNPGKVITQSPGRGLARIPGTSEMSFVDKSTQPWTITAYDPATGATRALFETLEGREDYAWNADGAAWMADDSRLYRRHSSEDEWQLVADLDARGVYGITRLAFAPDGKTLALVGVRPPADLSTGYRNDAGKIIGAALTDQEGWKKLEHLATVIGHRLSGSEGLARAIDWAVEGMRAEGLAVRKQPVMVPHWVRGKESAAVVAPVPREMRITGLGNSVGTPPEGVTAPVVVVESFEELEALGREGVEGKIVVYAVPWKGYGKTVQFRGRGASRAAALGAVAALNRSATGFSLSTPHTGSLRYDEEQPKIPAAAITAEDSEWFKRMRDAGLEVTVNLKMEAQMLPDVESFNVIAEIPGSERPEEVVVMGGHYDSWDLGQGVHDDGAACIAAWQALRIIDGLGLVPRRTLRVVLWTNEENGLRGGRAYRDALSDRELADHVAAIEMDGGCERPVGYGLGISGIDPNAEKRDPKYERAFAMLEQIGRLLEAIEAQTIARGGGGADIGPLMRDGGVPGLGLRTVGEHYFDWHHTDADTLDKVDPQNFRKAIAVLGVMGYVLADMPERLLPPE